MEVEVEVEAQADCCCDTSRRRWKHTMVVQAECCRVAGRPDRNGSSGLGHTEASEGSKRFCRESWSQTSSRGGALPRDERRETSLVSEALRYSAASRVALGLVLPLVSEGHSRSRSRKGKQGRGRTGAELNEARFQLQLYARPVWSWVGVPVVHTLGRHARKGEGGFQRTK